MWNFNEETGVLTIIGEGAMPYYYYINEYYYANYTWVNLRLSILEVVIGNGVTSIGDFAFYKCSNLAFVTIPNSVTSIGNYAFAYSYDLAEVTNLATTPQTITEDVFWGVTLSVYTLKVPAASVELYQAAGIWKYFGSILPIGDAGVDDILTKNISIYPNPVQNGLRVESGELRVEKVEIVDLSGKTVSMFSNAGYRINVSHLPAGIYFIKIETGKGAVTRKFVKE